MNRLEFISVCANGGYCTKKQAEEFAGERDEFTEQDVIDVFRKYSSHIPAPGKWHYFQGAKTTYRAYGMKSNEFDNWG